MNIQKDDDDAQISFMEQWRKEQAKKAECRRYLHHLWQYRQFRLWLKYLWRYIRKDWKNV